MRLLSFHHVPVLVAIGSLLFASEPERLPLNVHPISYDLALVPDTERLTFSGQVRVAIDVRSQAESIILNQDGLTVDRATLDTSETATSVTPDQKLQRVALAFDRPVSAGPHTLVIDYHGPITTGTQGFFAMDYNGATGKHRTLATNFEPASERRLMPSWDEPALKATFRLTLDVPADDMAVSNMPIESTETLDGRRKRVHFETTPKMSTYLFFLAIGDFERILTTSDGTEVGVVVNRGDTEKGQYALQQAAKILHYYNGYFGIPYPLPKLDLVVAPGRIGGAMENWGAIFYSQRLLLFDPKRSTESARQRVFQVVSHEMAHQWFGDLVTMAWWDNLWLNEGFARWMQTRVADELHPEWKTGLQALDIYERGKRADAKPSTHPILQPVLNASQAEQAFDAITYDKGASVITMLEKYAGADAFRDGVRKYMRAHAYGNTVDADLWQSVQDSAGKPIMEIERDFTAQPGLPLIKVGEVDSKGSRLMTLSYERFYEDPSEAAHMQAQTWHVPVPIAWDDKTTAVLLTRPGTYSTVALKNHGPAIVNAGQLTFARTLYSRPQFEGIHTHFASISTIDQFGILLDYWAFGQSGYTPAPDYLELARAAPADADPIIWMQIAGTLQEIDWLYPESPGRETFRKFARGLLQPIAARLNWEPRSNEDPNNTRLRTTVLQALAQVGDSGVIAEARKRLDAALSDSGDMAPATRSAVIAIAAAHADAGTVDRLMAEISGTKDPLEKQSLLVALLREEDPQQTTRVLDFANGPGAVAGSSAYTFGIAAQAHPDLAWQRALQYFAQPNASMDSQSQLMLMPIIAQASSDLKRIDDLEAYAEKHISGSARQFVESAVATIKTNAKFRSRGIPEINRWLAAQ